MDQEQEPMMPTGPSGMFGLNNSYQVADCETTPSTKLDASPMTGLYQTRAQEARAKGLTEMISEEVGHSFDVQLLEMQALKYLWLEENLAT